MQKKLLLQVHFSAFTQIICVCFLTIITAAQSENSQGFIRCPLVWKPYSLENDIPNDAIRSSLSVFMVVENNQAVQKFPQDFVIRGRPIFQNTLVVGRFDNATGAAIIADSLLGALKNPFGLEVLQNDFGCSIAWVTASSGGRPPTDYLDLLVPAATGSDHYVGSRRLGDKDYVSGDVAPKNGFTLSYADRSGKKVETQSFDYLVSYSDGLHMELKNLEFAEGVFEPTLELMGTDEVNNNSPATVTQSLRHKKSMTISTSFTHEKHSGSSFNFGIQATIPIPNPYVPNLSVSLGFSFSRSSSKSELNRHGREETVEIATVREITVRPYTSVQVCTLLGKVEKFSNVPFTAQGFYTAKGWTGDEIHQYLSSRPDPPRNMNISSSYVTSDESAIYTGQFPFSNTMYVLNADDERNCDSVQETIAKLESVRANRSRTGGKITAEESELRKEIADFVKVRRR